MHVCVPHNLAKAGLKHAMWPKVTLTIFPYSFCFWCTKVASIGYCTTVSVERPFHFLHHVFFKVSENSEIMFYITL